MLEPIEKAILKSQLHIQPIVKQDVVMIVLPPLSGERREMLLKLLGKKIEEARIRIRMIRDDAIKKIQGAEKDKEISEDEKFRLKTKLDEMVKIHNATIEEIANRKREEISS